MPSMKEEDSQHKCDAAPATPDVSFNAWVVSPCGEEDDTASSSTVGKASSSMSSVDDEDFLKCDEDIMEGLPSSKHRKSSLDERDVSIARSRLRPSLPYHLTTAGQTAAPMWLDLSCTHKLPSVPLQPVQMCTRA